MCHTDSTYHTYTGSKESAAKKEATQVKKTSQMIATKADSTDVLSCTYTLESVAIEMKAQKLATRPHVVTQI